jgi:hypothetical protein
LLAAAGTNAKTHGSIFLSVNTALNGKIRQALAAGDQGGAAPAGPAKG